MSDHNDLPPDSPSKSQRKRDMHRLQELGVQLLDLSATELQSLELPEPLQAAVSEARRLKTHESRRRQAQLIGKLMRGIDPEPVRAYLEQRSRGIRQQTADFHELERWREELIAGGDEAIEQLLQRYPEADRSRLRQWVRAARQTPDGAAAGHPKRKLFRYLRELRDSCGHG